MKTVLQSGRRKAQILQERLHMKKAFKLAIYNYIKEPRSLYFTDRFISQSLQCVFFRIRCGNGKDTPTHPFKRRMYMNAVPLYSIPYKVIVVETLECEQRYDFTLRDKSKTTEMHFSVYISNHCFVDQSRSNFVSQSNL